jgi:S-adenosylmethionine-diacylglycerol 3-amino-3-carboxypropyl transferase
MSKTLTQKVSFDFLRYANCWEDADILLQGLNPHAGSKILSIGSAGDNSFSLLTSNPELVVAVDVNKIQLYLIELKKAAIEALAHQDLIGFLGFRPSTNRLEVFEKLKPGLSNDASIYWQNNSAAIAAGVISQGKFENYFHLFSRRVLPLIHSKKTTEKLLGDKAPQNQEQFYDKHWNSWRWKLLFKLFFSKPVMGRFGRDPEFLKEVKIPVGEYIYKKAEKHLKSAAAQNNFFLRYNLTGSPGSLLPHYLQPENLEKIKQNIHKLRIKEGYAEDAVTEYGKFHYMNLSNIFEYMDMPTFGQVSEKLLHSTFPGGRLAYWNLMVPRRISGLFPEKADYQKELSSQLSAIDKGFFYNQFIIDQVK